MTAMKLMAKAGIVNGKKYELTPDILENKDDYEFLQWDLDSWGLYLL